MVAKISEQNVRVTTGSKYPRPYDAPCLLRRRARLGDAAGLTQFGVNRLHLPPGSWSSQRHWHSAEDEFVFVLSGEVMLLTDAGEELLRAGEAAGFKAGVANGHQLQNRSASEAVVLEVGSRRPGDDAVDYPDIDMQIPKGQGVYAHRDGRVYDNTPPRQ